jgi:N-hydroxyarylamine O-acetyltransferase
MKLDAYFDRIGWGGPTPPTLDTLAGLLAAHMTHVPFENLDVLLGRRPRLDLEALQAKVVYARRGGYCFEQVTLFSAVLERLGFALARHTARVVLRVPRSASPRAHMIVAVRLPEGTFLVDPGFGGLSPRSPLPLAAGREMPFGDEVHWLAREDGYWVLRARTGGQVVDCWATALDEDNAIDFEVGNHYTSSHPASPFVSHLMLCAHTAAGRVTVANRLVTIRDARGERVEEIADRPALRALLTEHFGFDLPEVERLRVPAIPEWS